MSAHFFGSAVASDSLRLIADWTHALSEKGELSAVLNRLMLLIRADAAMIVRTLKSDGLPKYVARCDAESGKLLQRQPQSYAPQIVGAFMSAAKAGSIWKLSEAAQQCPTDGVNYQKEIPTGLVEAFVCPLESTSKHVDHIEIHFRHKPAEHDLNLVIMLLGTIAAGWNRRAPASISRALNQKRNFFVVRENTDIQIAILDIDNPANLSRSEFRICSLLKEGMTVNVIAANLSVSPATVRSHLSSIFSKTGASSQVELLHQLNRAPPPVAVPAAQEMPRVFQA